MIHLIDHAPDNPEFARVIELARLRDAREFDFDISPTPEEAQAVARLMGARSIRKLFLKGRLAEMERGGWRLDATLGATVIQTCVVTLDPVTTRVDQEVRRRYLPAAPQRPGSELILSPDEDEEDEPLTDRVDLGLVAIEALALALPAYPRKPGAALAQIGLGGGEDVVKPFAALAALRDKLADGT